MKILFDTSVLVAAMVEAHPMYSRAFPWLERAKGGEFEYLAASHSLAELYAVLTVLPVKPRISPGTALHLVHENVETCARIISLSVADYCSVVKWVAEHALAGGIIYDSLIVKAAQKAGADHVLTFNQEDFKRVWHGEDSFIIVP